MDTTKQKQQKKRKEKQKNNKRKKTNMTSSSSQIFKNRVPNNILIKLLDNISTKTDGYYTIDNSTYKKGIFTNLIPLFMNECKPYYHVSKQSYIDRKLTYNSFVTVFRQICNHNNITYTSHIKYDKSTYNIIYYIYVYSG